mgnify:FL=1
MRNINKNFELGISKAWHFVLMNYGEEMCEKSKFLPSPSCGFLIGLVVGTKDVISGNFGFKNPCSV